VILLSKRHLRAAYLALSVALSLTQFAVANSAIHRAAGTHFRRLQYSTIRLVRIDEDRPVHVRGYTKKDGTYVAPHTRSLSETRRARSSTRTGQSSRQTSAENRNAIHTSVQRDQHGRIHRSAAAKSSFQRQRPCPATGSRQGRCPGYVVDHVKPLECGGADAPSNMQWQTTADAKAKDRTERLCR
jgi:hypothetical protein